MNSLVKDALKLVIITVVAGLVLGAVYGITKKPIADQEAKAQMEAYKAVFPKASDFKDVDGFSEEAASKVIASYIIFPPDRPACPPLSVCVLYHEYLYRPS